MSDDTPLAPEEIAAAESLVEPVLYGSGGGNEHERLPTIQEIALRLRALRAEFERENARLREAIKKLADCPWPTDVWPNTVEEVGKMLRQEFGDLKTTAVTGPLMRHGWLLAAQNATIEAALSAETKTARTA